MSKGGVPCGNMWASARVGSRRKPIRTVASHRGRASEKVRESCVVGVNVYGNNPKTFKVIKNMNNDTNKRAHL